MDSTSLTPLEVAELLKITKNTVYELIKRGELPAYKVGKKLRIDKEDINNYINNQKKGSSSPQTKHLKQEILANDIAIDKDMNIDDKNIIICGQDMILDILGRNIESRLPSIKSYRSYMGSYNGLINLYTNKASIASAHLWDWETSEYNIDFVKKLLPGIPCTIINLTYRIQGFYVQKGNPKNIKGWDDLKRNDLNYINREIGCGVRVLLDGKLRELLFIFTPFSLSNYMLSCYHLKYNNILGIFSNKLSTINDFIINI